MKKFKLLKHDFSGYHRSGWNYVFNSLYNILNDDNAEITLDTFLDQTFYDTDFQYNTPWIGIIHHTFNKTFSNMNNYTLLDNPNFIKSLTCCRGLFVFSNNQKIIWARELAKKFIKIQIVSLIHPTEFVDSVFTIENFQKNNHKKIVQIGAWLRDNYAIYRLNNGNPIISFDCSNQTQEGSFPKSFTDTCNVQKHILIGKQMEHYVKPLDFFEKLGQVDFTPFKFTFTRELSINGFLPYFATVDEYSCPSRHPSRNPSRDPVSRNPSRCPSRGNDQNKYVLGALNMLKSYDNSVKVIQMLSNESYDILLSENVVFVKLIDAAAVNTLVECIVRNTPIFINKLPAVLELLGNNYPLYIDNEDDVLNYTYCDIFNATRYLQNLDKKVYTIDYFIDSVVNSGIFNAIPRIFLRAN
jgi:hypothetical protein